MADRVLITGAGGFVGRHFSAALNTDGVSWIGLERPEAATDHFIAHDLGRRTDSAPRQLADLMAEHGITQVVHLAGQSSAGASFADPVGTVRVNLHGTMELLEALRLLQADGAAVPTTLAIGSAEEYGAAASQERPCHEDDPILPISPYGTSKAAATLLCVQYHQSFDLPVMAVRAFSHTGPGHDQRFVFPSFAGQIAAIEAGQAEPVLRVGNLSPDRDFSDVRDVVRAYRALLASGEPGQVYNVCSGSSLTIQDGLDILLGLSSASVRVQPDPARLRPVDIPRLVGDPSRLMETTGWSAGIEFTDTLRGLLEAARRNLS